MVNGCEAVRRRADEGRGTIYRALLIRRARQSHAPTLVRPAAKRCNNAVTRSRPYNDTADASPTRPYPLRVEAVGNVAETWARGYGDRVRGMGCPHRLPSPELFAKSEGKEGGIF